MAKKPDKKNIFLLLLALVSCSSPPPNPVPGEKVAPKVPQGLIDLIAAYPGHFRLSYPDALWWNDGTIMPYNLADHLYSVPARVYPLDLELQMSIPYKPGPYTTPIPKGDDPGRYRYIPFFRKMYGSSPREVEKHLVPQKWLSGRTIQVTTINGVDKKLAAVIEELKQLDNHLKKYVEHTMGMYYYRNILGSPLLSPHSFGIAIDIDVKYSHYWQWDYSHLPRRELFRAEIEYRNNIPLEIVEIFEKYGFIWGGKWYHYDTMHFEYRPELFPSMPRASADNNALHQP